MSTERRHQGWYLTCQAALQLSPFNMRKKFLKSKNFSDENIFSNIYLLSYAYFIQ